MADRAQKLAATRVRLAEQRRRDAPTRPVEELVPICACCRTVIDRFQVTDGKVYLICDREDCSRWASVRGLRIVARGRHDPWSGRLY